MANPAHGTSEGEEGQPGAGGQVEGLFQHCQGKVNRWRSTDHRGCIRQHLGMDLPKDHPSVIAAYEWVTEQFEHGRQTSIAWEELQPLVHDVHVLV